MTAETFLIVGTVILLLSAIYVGYRRYGGALAERFFGEATELLALGLEAFSAGQLTHLSPMALPGGTRTFAAKSEAPEPEPPFALKREKKWHRHGEVRPVSLGISRF
jgi:hypothetical protein